MLQHFSDYEPDHDFETDLCIIGAGPAGIALAREFNQSPYSILLLESGDLEPDRRIQDLYKGTNTRGDFSLRTSRLRLFGGTSYVWGGWCAPLDESDFRKRAWVPHSGWPITRQDLLPYYQRAQGLCQLGRYRYDVPQWPELAGKTLELDPGKLEHRLWQLSPPTLFGEVYREELRQSGNVTVLLDATATGIRTPESAQSVAEVQLADLTGRRATVRARAFVIACGGIETARLMLASNNVEPKGLANRHDLVGRYFMEHAHPDAGGVLLSGSAESFSAYAEHQLGEERIVLGFGPSERAQERLGILNSSIAVAGPLYSEPGQGWDSLMKLSRAANDLEWPEEAGGLVADVLRDLDDVLREGYRRARDEPVLGFRFAARTETAPNPANRVTLADERDALGMNRARLDWNLGSLERTTVEKSMMMLAEEFGRLDVGRVQLNELLLADDDRWSQNLSWFGHHMGTTRMGDDPKTGVVDANCRVHGLANLYIASSSVFPTSGFANPTLTILALAIRLADHLKATAPGLLKVPG